MRSWMQPWFPDNDRTLDYDSLNKIDLISGRYNVPKSKKPLSVIAGAITEADEQYDSLAFVSTKHGSHIRDEFCDMLLAYVNQPFNSEVFTGVHLTTSGALAVEDAVKIAMQCKPGARYVISFSKSYHGASFGAGSCTGEERRKYVEKNTTGFLQAPNPSEDWHKSLNKVCDYVDDLGQENIACVVLEVVNTIHGLLHAEGTFYYELSEYCESHGIMLIVDEVLTGFYRTTRRFAFMHYQMMPDMVCFSKAVTNGQVPLGGVILHRNVRDCFIRTGDVFGVGSTYAGYPFGCAVGIQSLTWLMQNEHTADDLFREMVAARKALLDKKIPCNVFGLLMSVEFENADEARRAKQLLLNAKIIVDQHDQFIIMAPPFDLNGGLMYHVVGLIENIFKKVL